MLVVGGGPVVAAGPVVGVGPVVAAGPVVSVGERGAALAPSGDGAGETITGLFVIVTGGCSDCGDCMATEEATLSDTDDACSGRELARRHGHVETPLHETPEPGLMQTAVLYPVHVEKLRLLKGKQPVKPELSKRRVVSLTRLLNSRGRGPISPLRVPM